MLCRMDLSRLGEPLLRPRTSPVLSFLVPFLHSSHFRIKGSQQGQAALVKPSRQLRRMFHANSPCRASSASSSASDLDSLEDLPQPNLPQPSPTNAPQKSASDSQIDALLKSTFDVPHPSRRKASQRKETSASMLDASFRASEYYELRDRGIRSPGSLARSMTFPDTPGLKPSDGLNNTLAGRNTFQQPMRAKRTIRSRPTIGRTVEINPEREIDFGRALRTLEIQCAVNRVRADLQRQRFHERPGLKRKRLKSERWRKLFRESFRATVGRVKQMRRKGW